MSKKSLTKLTNTLLKFQIISIHDTLKADNNLSEIPFALGEGNIKYIKRICRGFKKKYNEELRYKFKEGIYYFSLK